ncbi:iron ABC transporter permease [Paenibacillus qinlingensis]|uniref:Iron complex transport system permease protein n=1 Tax=Paenibacillus qinlingensis TaxID=1837343 RepID=A0ABU1NWI6_9BACL|nr:iron ABC transporter permease [Paenibacillus qinlingensis]MDR6551813.1 iron complex transport system permease protein [Paenibacillus qinlingensis]
MVSKSAATSSVIHNKNGMTAYLIMLGGSIALLILMAFSVTQGAKNIPLSTFWEVIFNLDRNNMSHIVIMDLRLSRVLASALVGSAFAASGAVMQGITRNPMADSGLLGLNAGAGLALAVCFAFFPQIGYSNIIVFSFIGATIAYLMVNGIAMFRRSTATPMRIVLAGAAVGALFIALSQGIALYNKVAQNIMFWMAGGVAGVTWEQIILMSPWICIALISAIVLARYITILNMGEDVAKGLGLNTKLINLLCSLTVLVLAGASVSAVGAVGFVGLVVPHVTRFLVGVDYRSIIPVSAILGAILMVSADLGARMLNPPFETPVGVLTALVGIPFFLYLSRRQRRAV